MDAQEETTVVNPDVPVDGTAIESAVEPQVPPMPVVPVEAMEITEEKNVQTAETTESSTVESPKIVPTGAPEMPVSLPPSEGPKPVLPTDPDTRELYAKLLKQVEYYFGDSNLPQDKFLLATIAENADGWVDLEVLLRFNRLRELCNDPAVVADALKHSEDMLQVSEDGTKVRRRTQIKRLYKRNLKTIYAKGFPTDMRNVVDDIRDYFGAYGTVANVRARRDDFKKFKGSVFVEFSEESDAAKVRDLTLECQGQPLVILMKDEYVDKKLREHGSAEKPMKPVYNDRSQYLPQLSYLKPTVFTNSNSPNPTWTPRQQFEDRPEKSLLYFSDVSPLALMEDVRQFFSKHDERVRFINYSSGEPSGKVTFSMPEAAIRVIQALGGTSENEKEEPLVIAEPNGIAGFSTTVRMPTASEEDAFWTEQAARKSSRGGRQSGGRGGSGRGGSGGRGNGRGARGGGGRGRGGDRGRGRDNRIFDGDRTAGYQQQDRMSARPPTILASKRKADEPLPNGGDKTRKFE
ncbi:hypothetical protein PhCBS80983_g04167 [Powellomyces hirtus]|uniref:HTH La-type RNA-binding domain-containing protein n=1 Tax=Powellomyces hirtus TaxID=109895 RepID=A0A507DZ89_9FUNG|nr:hypothetical protein PhCBS80983_g04167 [Powellomyces hirtus]